MLFSEFVDGTGCKESEHNYKVYKELELIYMNSDCTKAHIYEMGKKLVDNSKSEKEIELENQIKEEIDGHKAEIEKYKGYILIDTESMNIWKSEGDKEMISLYRNNIKFWNREIKAQRNQINALKCVLN